MYEFLNFFI